MRVEVEALAAGQDGGGQLLRLGGGEDEHGVGRRLLQRLEQRVERAGGQHVHLVDDVDLVLRQRRRVLDLLAQIANLVHAVVAGRVDLHHVHAVFGLKGAADLAFAAGVAVLGIQAVDGLGEHLGGAGLAGSAGAAEQIGVGDAAGGHLAAKRLGDGVLTADFGKRSRTPRPVKHLIAQESVPPESSFPSYYTSQASKTKEVFTGS